MAYHFLMLTPPTLADAVQDLATATKRYSCTILGTDLTESNYNERTMWYDENIPMPDDEALRFNKGIDPVTGDRYNRISTPPIPWSDVQAKHEQNTADYTAKLYARKRVEEYPAPNQQLAVLYDCVNADPDLKIKFKPWLDMIDSIKNKYPK